jgi:hypothetical protein
MSNITTPANCTACSGSGLTTPTSGCADCGGTGDRTDQVYYADTAEAMDAAHDAAHGEDAKKARRHGGAYDRGAADAYYRRAFQPHYFLGGSYMSPKVEGKDMTVAEHAAYYTGFYDQVASGEFKEYE